MKKISNRQLAKNMEKMLGKRVKIMGGHTHEGQKGFTIRVELKNGVKPEMVVRLDSGEEITPSNKHLVFLVMENGVRVGDFPSHFINTPVIDATIAMAEDIMKNVTTEKPN